MFLEIVGIVSGLCFALLVHIPFAEFPYERGFPTMSRRIERIQLERRNSKTLWNDRLGSQPQYSTGVKRIAGCRLGPQSRLVWENRT